MPSKRSNSGNVNATKRSTKSATKINKDVEISRLKYEEPANRHYYCTACGKEYTKQETNFCKSLSPLFVNNNGFVHICKRCTDKLYYNLVEFFSGNEEKAMDRMCQIFDWYYSDEIFAATRKISENRSRVCAYPAKANLPQYDAKNKTYADTIIDRANDYIESVEDIEKMKSEGETSVTKVMFQRWGQVSESDMLALEEHYRMLKKYNPNADSNQEIFIKDLCFTKILQTKAFKDNNSGDWERYSKLYRDTFKAAGLKTIQEDDGTADNTLGVNAGIISQFSPEEFYKDKKLYFDFDGLGEYYERHVLRPLRNLEYNSAERDKEYSIGDNDENE